MDVFDLVVVGGGAAGFFGAIQAAEQCPGMRIVLLEKSNRLLAKVKISGGGRCNVTHHCFEPSPLSQHYPRGEKTLRTLFKEFHAGHAVAWFREKGVPLKTEGDGRMFPETDSSQTVIDCFMREALRHRIQIVMACAVSKLTHGGDTIELQCLRGETFRARMVLVASGGHTSAAAYDWLRATGHTVVPTIPSLFTFNDASKSFADLMGVAVPQAQVMIAGTKFVQDGPLLVTHWGLSGPAVIRLSAWAAEFLYQAGYRFTALVSWIGKTSEENVRANLHAYKLQHGQQRVIAHPLYNLPQRLWQKLCSLAAIEETTRWSELPKKNTNKLLENLIRCPFSIQGKTTFKEEFVTCGGIDLKEVHTGTMESKRLPGLFFAGEVLNIDGETGGFNFQAAWTTAYIAARAIASRVPQKSPMVE